MLFPPLREKLYAVENFTHAAFHIVVIHNPASSECIRQAAKKMEV
jgi:hypothetical protein